MQHIHLDMCHSTQKYLIEKTKDNPTAAAETGFIVSCEEQTQGIGQRANSWDSFKNSLCFSFTLAANELLNLSSLEMAVQICKFFKTKYHLPLLLKWPNDILNLNNEKVGGIIVNKSGEQDPIIGIGLNLFLDDTENKIANAYKIPAGFIFDSSFEFSKKDLSKEIVDFIKLNRTNKLTTITEWNKYCAHINKKISIYNESANDTGIFVGIGEHGQALLNQNGIIKEFYTGSVFFKHP